MLRIRSCIIHYTGWQNPRQVVWWKWFFYVWNPYSVPALFNTRWLANNWTEWSDVRILGFTFSKMNKLQ